MSLETLKFIVMKPNYKISPFPLIGLTPNFITFGLFNFISLT